MKKLLPVLAVAAGMLLAGCAGSATPSAPTTPRMSVQESCKFLTTDTFAPTGNDKERAGQIGQHYQEVADKVAPEVSEPIQQMANIMKQVGSSATGRQTPEQLTQLRQQMDKIGEHCK